MFYLNNFPVKTVNDIDDYKAVTDFEKEVVVFLKDWFSDSSTVEVKTSGSTGKPKTIVLEKKRMIKSAELTLRFFGLKAGDKALLCLPLRSIAGKMMVVRAVVGGLNLLLVRPNRNPLKQISTRISFSAMTPMQVETVLGETPKQLNLINTLIIGGAEVSQELERNLSQYEVRAYSTFGMTETITHIAVRELNKSTVFTGLSGVRFSVDKDDCLIIKAPHLKEASLKTNDIVELESKTEFLWKGRKDNVINTGGIKIIAEDVESLLKGVFSHTRFYVTSKKDKLLGEKIVVVVESQIPLLLEDYDFSFLPKYHSPKEIITVNKMKETPTGKLKREKY